MSEESELKGGISRRDVITRGAIAGGALIWAAPMVTGVTPAFAAATSPASCAPFISGATVSYQDNANGAPTFTKDFVTVTIGFSEPCPCTVEFANWTGTFNGNALTGDLTTPTNDHIAEFQLAGSGRDFPGGLFVFDTDVFACCNGVVTGATHIHIEDTYGGTGTVNGATPDVVTTSASSAVNLTCL